jgi:hypothetical protein
MLAAQLALAAWPRGEARLAARASGPAALAGGSAQWWSRAPMSQPGPRPRIWPMRALHLSLCLSGGRWIESDGLDSLARAINSGDLGEAVNPNSFSLFPCRILTRPPGAPLAPLAAPCLACMLLSLCMHAACLHSLCMRTACLHALSVLRPRHTVSLTVAKPKS